MYLTGASNPAVLRVAHEHRIGVMLQPGNGYTQQVGRWPHWAADNGCFARPETFDADSFIGWLAGIPHSERCLFAVAPDRVQDAQATLTVALPVLPRIRAVGLPAAFVAQNGLTVETTPWGALDVLFLGGDNAFKLGPTGQALTTAAKQRGKWVHMGRVNSLERLRAAQVMGCDSADGTYLKYGPDVNLPRLVNWLRVIGRQPAMALWEGVACG